MKKILITLLLVTSFANAQALFDKGIKNTGAILENVPDFMVTQKTNGVYTKSELPVKEYASAINLPVTGVAGVIYVTKDNNLIYRWNGTIYQELSATDISGKVDKNTAITGATKTKITYDSKGLVTAGSDATKSDVGLGNVDNTSDVNKPVSTATQTALNLKANLASPAFTGTPTAPTATAGTNTTQVATTAFVLANSSSIPQLEYNNADKTVWNNGKGNVVNNTSFGDGALRSNTTGSGNTAIGAISLYSNTTGVYNTSNGYNSLYSNTTGGTNIANGYNSGNYIANGTTPLTISNNSVFLGADTKALTDNSNNEIVIGYNAIGAGSNTATLGNTSITSTILRGAVTGGSFIKSGATATNLLQANGVDIAQLSLPISTATQNALDGKLSTSGGLLSGALTINSFLKFQTSGSEISTIATTLGLLGSGSSTDMNAYIYGNNEYGVWTNGVKRQTISGNGTATFSSSVTASSLKATNLAGTGDSAVGTDSAGNLKRMASTDSRPYKVYTALLTQSGTSAPVATVLENTLGSTISWSYGGTAGNYVFTGTSGTFPINKSICFVTRPIETASGSRIDVIVTAGTNNITTNNGTLTVFETSTKTPINDALVRTALEIRVYN